VNDHLQAILTAVSAAAGPFGIWLWKYLEHRAQRADKSFDQSQTREGRLFERQDNELKRKDDEIRAREADITRLEGEREAYSALAWAWFTKSNELRHELLVYQLSDRNPDGSLRRPAVPPLPGFREISTRNGG
jgi:hypothetical protein